MTDAARQPLTISARGDRVSRARRWNIGLVACAVALFAIASAGLFVAVSTGFGSWFTYILLGLFALLCVVVVWTARSRTRMLRLLTTGDAVLRIDDAGVRLPGLGEIAWSELVFVCVTNDRARTERARRVPVYGWAGRAAINAGNGTILCELAVRDGESLRSRASGPAAASRVTLYPRWKDGMRRGTVPLLLDAVYDELDTQAVVRVLFTYAEAHGIPHALFEQLSPAMMWKGPYLDDIIAGARPRAV